MTTRLLAATVPVGDHYTVKIFGQLVNIDTVGGTVLAGLIVIALGFYLRAKVVSDVPSKVQVVWEFVVGFISEQVHDTLGMDPPGYVIPLAVTLFTFILIANWLSVLPTGYPREYVPPPTADVNLTFAMAFLVIVLVHVEGIRRKGFGTYLAGFARPNKALLPIHIIEEIVKPFTLALRLFGNLFAGGIMVSIIALMGWLGIIPFDPVWKLFDMFIGAIQAFIFALLTILYFGFATAESH